MTHDHLKLSSSLFQPWLQQTTCGSCSKLCSELAEVMRTELQLVLQPEGWGAALSMHVSCRCRFDSSILMRLPESCRIGPGSTLETLGLVLSELCHSAAMPASSKISESTRQEPS